MGYHLYFNKRPYFGGSVYPFISTSNIIPNFTGNRESTKFEYTNDFKIINGYITVSRTKDDILERQIRKEIRKMCL